jgi:hypothetical protein
MSIILTLLGGVLTVLILPAVTRQWDDRQKARELKAALVEQIALTVLRSDQYIEATETTGTPEGEHPLLVDSLRIEAKLRTYFGPKLTTRWKVIHRRILGLGELAEVVSPIKTRRLASTDLMSVYVERYLFPPNHELSRQDQILVNRLADNLLSGIEPLRVDQMWSFRADVQAIQARLADDILDADIEGFSTTSADLIRDILPGI